MKEFRTSTGLSQQQFADYYGISVRTLQQWEQGRRTPPEYIFEMMKRIWKLDHKKTYAGIDVDLSMVDFLNALRAEFEPLGAKWLAEINAATPFDIPKAAQDKIVQVLCEAYLAGIEKGAE